MIFFILLYTALVAKKSMASNNDTGELNNKENNVNDDTNKPNFIIIMADDMGYGDWNYGGNPTIYTPNLNKLANEGIYMSQFYSGSPICSPSRASLLTGRNTIRTGVINVFLPVGGQGLPEDEITMAEAIKPLGYKTACIGKWHLGSNDNHRPLSQGFDYFYGLLYSNDMYQPDLYRNDEVIESPTIQSTLTKRYTEEAIKFITDNKNNPFFLYLPHTMPHIPLAVSDDFAGKSKHGLYGDVIEEIDWSVGKILDTVESYGLGENTFIIFTSDNGPWTTQKQKGGNAGLLRGAKGDTWEGGMRVPTIFRWTGHLPEGEISTSVGSFTDIFPTITTLAGAKINDTIPMDGINLIDVLYRTSDPVRTIYYYKEDKLNAIRHGKWKLHFRYYNHKSYNHQKGGYNLPWNWIKPGTPLLFDLEIDPSEKFNRSDDFPDIVDMLTKLAKDYKNEIEAFGENEELIRWFKNDYLKYERLHQSMKIFPALAD